MRPEDPISEMIRAQINTIAHKQIVLPLPTDILPISVRRSYETKKWLTLATLRWQIRRLCCLWYERKLESRDLAMRICEHYVTVTQKLGIYVFKALLIKPTVFYSLCQGRSGRRDEIFQNSSRHLA